MSFYETRRIVALIGMVLVVISFRLGRAQPHTLDPGRVQTVGGHDGECAAERNACENATLAWMSRPPDIDVRISREAAQLKACRKARVCMNAEDQKLEAKRKAASQQVCMKLKKHQSRALSDVCSYDRGDGNWTCRVPGCGPVKLIGVQTGENDSDPCGWIHSLDSELMLEQTRGVASCKTKQCQVLSRCVDRMRTTLTGEMSTCSCRYPAPRGISSRTICQAERWRNPNGDPRPSVVLSDDAACSLLTEEWIHASLARPRPTTVIPTSDPLDGVTDEQIDDAGAKCVAATSRWGEIRNSLLQKCGSHCSEQTSDEQLCSKLQSESCGAALEVLATECVDWRRYQSAR
jgi:hypothetical protein